MRGDPDGHGPKPEEDHPDQDGRHDPEHADPSTTRGALLTEAFLNSLVILLGQKRDPNELAAILLVQRTRDLLEGRRCSLTIHPEDGDRSCPEHPRRSPLLPRVTNHLVKVSPRDHTTPPAIITLLLTFRKGRRIVLSRPHAKTSLLRTRF
ncbi:hypothetical protein KBB27_02060 [Patescibacteria group bacterium]|nr:hypothetical protein [Patescibacteria group bacterium]